MDNQTWFDATLVLRVDECNPEVTIHRPNVSTRLSIALIRGDLIAATRGPFTCSLISCPFYQDSIKIHAIFFTGEQMFTSKVNLIK